ncbi:rho GTPase-activating protein 11A isoform X2 [Periophthalmus magnuspinnatus]|uniref:rho GTPase-activating protein 11A isoform X2 n=1 Tax=Periophthalmus magnuspinnatus TaxID=409849 RepID=UPI0024364F7E|nr:rho GTPase-activating protein 11A isoform X2 [Periophthalmus magnuspinnatus]
MKVMERNMMRLVAVQHLRTTYGIKAKNWNKNKASRTSTSISNKVFGVPLDNLPCYNTDNGIVPRFLVDACINLMAHVDTEGLFRKSGSVLRLKALRAKLDAGEDCLSTALPCDVAGLVKQFFRELPEPVLASELQDAFLKAQQLNSDEERTAATMLLSCVLAEKNQNTLRHFFEFLHSVSLRSAENKMDSSNLSVILAPNLLHSGDATEKMKTNTEKRLKLQAAVIHCFIENAHSFGVLPPFLQERVPAMIGCDSGALSPTHDELRELDLNSGMKRRPRRSFGVFPSATPVIATPNSKRKLPLESGHSFGFSNKKRRSMKKNLGIDLLPDPMLNETATPGSVCSASGVLDAPNTCASGGRSQRRSVTSARRKSRRLGSRHAVNRVESGRAGCFSPKVNKKDAPLKSLRMRFSLGKSSKDAGSESIGWRLASQESTTSFCFTKEMEFISPSVLPRLSESNGIKYISKSEDNLLTPQPHSSGCQAVWTETPVTSRASKDGGSFPDTPMSMCLKNTFSSEPAIVISKPSPVSSRPLKLCCASSADSLESEGAAAEAQIPTGPTLLKNNQAFTAWSSDGRQPVARDSPAKTSTSDDVSVPHPETPVNSVAASSSMIQAQESFLSSYDNVTFGQMDLVCLSPLHIDSVVFDCDTNSSFLLKGSKGTPLSSTHEVLDSREKEEELVDCSRLIDALDIQSPAHFKLGASSGLQSTPYRPDFEPCAELCTPPRGEHSVVGDEKHKCTNDQEVAVSPDHLQSQKRRVAERIQHFNRLTLCYPEGSQDKASRSPLRFQRTPVRQTVRRINSLLGDNRRPTRGFVRQSMQVPKAVSLETGLSPYPQVHSVKSVKKPPPVPPKKPSTLARKAKQCALEDVTNKAQPKTKVNTSECHKDQPGPQKPFVQQVVEKEMHHYRGSPRNPLTQTRLLSATKPVDL